MVAALFQGDLRYGVTVFGSPTSLDGLITPTNYALPDTLRRCVDVEVDLTFYAGVELFRARRFEADSNNLTLFSIQTHAYSINSGRPGPFIGAGIFARAALDPVALVKALRELLRGAQSVLMRDGRFIVHEIGDSEKRLVSIPDSVDAVPDSNGHWFDKPIKTNHVKHMLILPTAHGVKSPEEFFRNVIFDPYAYSRTAFFCTDERVANDCRQRSLEFEVLTIDKVLERHRLAFDGLIHKTNSHAKELLQKEQQFAKQLSQKEQDFQKATSQIKDEAVQLRSDKADLIAKNEKLRGEIARLRPAEVSSESNVVNLLLGATAVFLLVLLLGFGGYKLYEYFTPTSKKNETSKKAELTNETGENFKQSNPDSEMSSDSKNSDSKKVETPSQKR